MPAQNILVKNSFLWASAFHFLLAALVACLGVFCVHLSINPLLQVSFFSLLREPGVLFYLGISGIVFSMGLFIFFYFVHRKPYYQLKMQGGFAEIDAAVMQEIITRFFVEKMPHIPARIEVSFLSKKEMEIKVFISGLLEEAFYKELNKCETSLKRNLANLTGYRGSWIVTVFSE